jgi:secondary thiamine-phosphate synthase enzyme
MAKLPAFPVHLKDMSKRSTATVREQPVAAQMSVSGPLFVHSESFTLDTRERLELHDLTDRVMATVRDLPIREGTVNIFSMHTTCTIFINEVQKALTSDIKKFLEQAVDSADAWMHNDPRFSECDRGNADSHLRALLLGHTLTLQVSGGEVVLGQWQRILFAELDGPRPRTVRLQVMGVQ